MPVPRTASRLSLTVLAVVAGAVALVVPVLWLLAGLAAAAAVVTALAPANRTRPAPAADTDAHPAAAGVGAVTVLTV